MPRQPKPKRPCAVQDCPNFARSNGLCDNHYRLYRRRGWLSDFPPQRKDIEAAAIAIGYMKREDYRVLVEEAKRRGEPIELYIGRQLSRYVTALTRGERTKEAHERSIGRHTKPRRTDPSPGQ